MSREYWVIVALALGAVALLGLAGAARRPRECLFLFVVGQTISWPVTILMVYFGLIRSPVRLFPQATESNFMMAFVFFPAVFVAYYRFYPREKGWLGRMAYSLAVTGAGALLHAGVQKYTALLMYVNYSGFHSWLTLGLSFYIARVYCDWFFARLKERKAKGA